MTEITSKQRDNLGLLQSSSSPANVLLDQISSLILLVILSCDLEPSQLIPDSSEASQFALSL